MVPRFVAQETTPKHQFLSYLVANGRACLIIKMSLRRELVLYIHRKIGSLRVKRAKMSVNALTYACQEYVAHEGTLSKLSATYNALNSKAHAPVF